MTSTQNLPDNNVLDVRSIPIQVKSVDTPGSECLRLHQCSVPFPSGFLNDATGIRLSCGENQSLELDRRVMTRWPDGSIQWVQLYWLAISKSQVYQLEVSPQSSHQNVSSTDVSDSIPQHAVSVGSSNSGTVSNGEERDLCIKGVIFNTDITLEDGTRLQWVMDQERRIFGGSLVTDDEYRGRLLDSLGNVALDWRAQVRCCSQTATQQWQLTIRNPKRANHPGGIWELGDPNSVLLRSAQLAVHMDVPATVGIRGAHAKTEPSETWKTRQSSWKLCQLGSGGPNFNSPIHRHRDGQVRVPVRGFQLNDDQGQTTGDRATPSLIVEHNDGKAFAIDVPKFWQTFPKGLQWQNEKLVLSIFPEQPGCWHEMLPGEQSTTEFCICVGGVEELQQSLSASALEIQVAPEWICQSRVIPWLTPRKDSICKEYLALVDQVVLGDDTFVNKRERIDQYGWRNFGDAWGDHEAVHSDPNNPLVSHYNNQYDMVLGLGLNYLRGGDRQWLDLMNELARHVIDIDIYNTDQDLACYNHGMFWHTIHYIDAGLGTHRSYPRGTCGGGPSSGHAYARGLMLYYCLTGDETAREAVINLGNWMIASEDGSKTKYRWLAGGESGLTTASGSIHYHGPGRGPGNCLEVLVTAFQISGDRRFLDQAEHIIKRVVHPNQDIDALDLTDAERKWFYVLFLQALGRYLEVKISFDEIDSMYAYGQTVLLRYADWMAEHESPYLDHPERLEFPTETWAAQEMRKVEVFQWAARHAKTPKRERFLEKAKFYFDTSVEQLNRFETKSCCRPVALLLTSGYSHDFFRRGGLEVTPEAPSAPSVDFPPQRKFTPQKVRAIRNAKLILGSGTGLALLVLVAALAWWIS